MEELPRPYLSAQAIRDRLAILGFEFEDGADRLPVDTPEGRKKFTALMELIAGAIAEWAQVEAEINDINLEEVNNELNTFAQEYLVG